MTIVAGVGGGGSHVIECVYEIAKLLHICQYGMGGNFTKISISFYIFKASYQVQGPLPGYPCLYGALGWSNASQACSG